MLASGMVICLGRGADLHMAHLMPLSLTNWFYLLGFAFLVLAHPGSPGQNPESCKTVVVVVVMVTESLTANYLQVSFIPDTAF